MIRSTGSVPFRRRRSLCSCIDRFLRLRKGRVASQVGDWEVKIAFWGLGLSRLELREQIGLKNLTIVNFISDTLKAIKFEN